MNRWNRRNQSHPTNFPTPTTNGGTVYKKTTSSKGIASFGPVLIDISFPSQANGIFEVRDRRNPVAVFPEALFKENFSGLFFDYKAGYVYRFKRVLYSFFIC